MTGAELKLVRVRQADFDPTTRAAGRPPGLHGKGDRTSSGSRASSTSAAACWQTPQHFAIVLDRDIKSFPQIDYTDPSLSNGIAGGGRSPSIGKYSEAKDLAIVLQTGALPYVSSSWSAPTISATLGKDSLQQAKIAAAIAPPGRRPLPAALLPLPRRDRRGRARDLRRAPVRRHPAPQRDADPAGLRRHDPHDRSRRGRERRHLRTNQGRGPVREVRAGGDRRRLPKGFHTIIDANVVTAITALVLFAVATASVKGFALMLLIGTALSLLTAVAATRAMLGMLADTRWFNNPTFMGAKGQAIPNWQKIDVNSPKRRRLFLTIATVAIVASVVLLVFKGLNLGIDFKGGTQLTFKTPNPVSLTKVRDQMSSIGRSDAIVQGVGASSGDNYRSFQVRTRSLTAEQQGKSSRCSRTSSAPRRPVSRTSPPASAARSLEARSSPSSSRSS